RMEHRRADVHRGPRERETGVRTQEMKRFSAVRAADLHFGDEVANAACIVGQALDADVCREPLVRAVVSGRRHIESPPLAFSRWRSKRPSSNTTTTSTPNTCTSPLGGVLTARCTGIAPAHGSAVWYWLKAPTLIAMPLVRHTARKSKPDATAFGMPEVSSRV